MNTNTIILDDGLNPEDNEIQTKQPEQPEMVETTEQPEMVETTEQPEMVENTEQPEEPVKKEKKKKKSKKEDKKIEVTQIIDKDGNIIDVKTGEIIGHIDDSVQSPISLANLLIIGGIIVVGVIIYNKLNKKKDE